MTPREECIAFRKMNIKAFIKKEIKRLDYATDAPEVYAYIIDYCTNELNSALNCGCEVVTDD